MPATFGQMLTAAREKRGLSIEDAAHETRIPAQRLRLLEAGNVAAFGSITYARSFVRAYSEYLKVDCEDFLSALPEGGVLGGERDYRYLTQTQGLWLRQRESGGDRLTAPEVAGVRRIKSPLPAALAVFTVILAGTAMWGMHVAETQGSAEPAALKALPVEDDAPAPLPPEATAALEPKRVDFPANADEAPALD